MPSDAPGARGTPTTEPAGRLSGWKDIASHLAKSVRTVQRWERELGLPVHRIPGPDGGQIVYAYRQELDDWLTRQPQEPAVVSDPPPAPAEIPAPPGPAQRVALIAAGTIIIAAAALIRFWPSAASAALPAVEFELVGHDLVARASDASVAWRHSFGTPISEPPTQFAPSKPLMPGHGLARVIVPVRFGPPGTRQPARSDIVVAFDADGAEVWRIDPAFEVTLGDRRITGPWHFAALAAGSGTHAGKVWLAFKHHTWSPGLVLEVDERGQSSMRYVQAGWVVGLAQWTSSAGDFLVAGGVSNQHARASVAVIDLGAAPAQGPPEADILMECGGCPTGRPRAFFLFPSTEITEAHRAAYGFATPTLATEDALKITMEQSIVAFIAPSLRPLSMSPGDNFWQVHRQMEGDGLIAHAATQCPERTATREVQSWTPESGWQRHSVAAASQPPPGR